MCRSHWAAVPRELQARVYATWDGAGRSTAWRQAAAAAIASVVQQGELAL